MKKDIKDETLLALHNAGHSTRQIEGIVKTLRHSAIARRLKRLTPRKTTDIYKELKADILADKQRQLLMQSGKLSPKEERDIAVAFGVYYDKEERIRGMHPEGKPLVIINKISIGTPPGDQYIQVIHNSNTDIKKSSNK